jgi:hypothetical protein
LKAWEAEQPVVSYSEPQPLPEPKTAPAENQEAQEAETQGDQKPTP